MKAVCNSEMSVIQMMDQEVNEQKGRVFNYALNKKKAISKLLKGANRTKSLDVEIKDGCVNLRFCNGSFYEIVLPLLKVWSMKVNETVQINDIDVKISEVDAGLENSDHHVDTKLVVHANGDRLVLHAYNGTQNLMVQGKNYENFAINHLQPYFLQNIEQSLDKIMNFNNVVKDKLKTKKPDKLKSEKPYKCAQCERKLSTIGDLRLHMKKCHTKPGLNSPKKSKALKTTILLTQNSLNDDTKILDTTAIQPFIPEVEELFNCNICDFDSENTEELNKHNKLIHSQEIVSEKSDDIKIRCLPNINTDEQDLDIEASMSDANSLLMETKIICGECVKGFMDEAQFSSDQLSSAGSNNISLANRCLKSPKL